MPMYDFVCTACGHTFEDLVSGEATPPCPRCGAATERQVSAPSPLKTGAFPFKPGPVRPMGQGRPPSLRLRRLRHGRLFLKQRLIRGIFPAGGGAQETRAQHARRQHTPQRGRGSFRAVQKQGRAVIGALQFFFQGFAQLPE